MEDLKAKIKMTSDTRREEVLISSYWLDKEKMEINIRQYQKFKGQNTTKE